MRPQLRPDLPPDVLASAPTYEAGGVVGELHEALGRRLAEAHRTAAPAYTPDRFERLCRVVSVASGYCALTVGVVATVQLLVR